MGMGQPGNYQKASNFTDILSGRSTCMWGVSGPVVRALDSGSDGPGSSPGWGTTLWP